MSERHLLDIPGGMLDLSAWSDEQLAAAVITIGQAQLARATGHVAGSHEEPEDVQESAPEPEEPEVRLDGQMLTVDGVSWKTTPLSARIIRYVLGNDRPSRMEITKALRGPDADPQPIKTEINRLNREELHPRGVKFSYRDGAHFLYHD